jgi:TonB family protein
VPLLTFDVIACGLPDEPTTTLEFSTISITPTAVATPPEVPPTASPATSPSRSADAPETSASASLGQPSTSPSACLGEPTTASLATSNSAILEHAPSSLERPVSKEEAKQTLPAKDTAETEANEALVLPGAYALPRRRAHSLAWVASLSLHASLLAAAAWLVATTVPHGRGATAQAPSGAQPIEPMRPPSLSTLLEVDTLFDDSQLRLPQVELEPPPSGAEPAARPDAAREGRGGERDVARPALNLADRDEAIDLSKDVQSRVDRSQVQRLRVAPDRASRDDRRATLEPMELTFLASGDGSWQERRPLAAEDPSRGARAASAPTPEGANAGAPARPPEGPLPPSPLGQARVGNRHASTGVGLLHGEPGPRHHPSADVAFARPLVTQGRPAVPADVNDKPRDNVESAQEVAANEQSLLHASTAGGQVAPTGRGGELGGAATGAGGLEGPGSRATPLGQGQGPLVDLDGSDPRLSDYHRRLLSKIHPLWANAFPRWAALEGMQGLAIIQFTVWPNGSITGVRVLRPSGVPEFDENVRRAVLRAAPFAPLPPNFHARSINFKITFDSPNPAVR